MVHDRFGRAVKTGDTVLVEGQVENVRGPEPEKLAVRVQRGFPLLLRDGADVTLLPAAPSTVLPPEEVVEAARALLAAVDSAHYTGARVVLDAAGRLRALLGPTPGPPAPETETEVAEE